MQNHAENAVGNQNRQIFFNMPLSKAVALFSVLFFAIIAFSSSIAYYFAMKKNLSDSCEREFISLKDFAYNLDLPENIFAISRDSVALGAKDKEVYKKAMSLKENSIGQIDIGNETFFVSHIGKLDLFLIGKYEIGIKEIMAERASKVFFILLLVVLIVFIAFNKFIARILKPINKNMQSYVEPSLYDELTKLSNRKYLNIKMEDEISRAVRAEYPISCMMIGLDKFKKYNDAYGHAEGDALLREAAKIFTNSLNRTQDLVAKMGGEEFCIVLPNTDLDGTKKIAEKIRIEIEKTNKTTISIGLISKIPTRRDTIEDLIKAADDKLYEAKNTGRNKVVF